MGRTEVELVRELFELSARGESEEVLAHYHPDVEWDARRTQPGVGDFAEVYRGHEGLRNFFRWWRQAWDSDEYENDEMIDAGDKVVSITTQSGRGRASGLQFERTIIGVWEFRDGRVSRVTWYLDRDEAFAAAGLSE